MSSLKDVRQSLVAKVLHRKHVCKVDELWSQKEEERKKSEQKERLFHNYAEKPKTKSEQKERLFGKFQKSQ